MANSENLQLLASINVKNRLGEGIFWHAASSSVWWTDIHGQALFQLRWPEQTLRQWPLPERISCFTLLNATDPMASRYPLLVAFASGLALYNPDSGATLWLAKPQQLFSGNRFNDGRVDRQGRFVLGRTAADTGRDVSDRDYFIRQRERPGSALLWGAPIKARSNGEWLVTATLPIRRANGDFDGLIVGASRAPPKERPAK